ncbi:PstS family phosphate ABC transporter substrate-binding protein [Undibacterium sp. Ji50W]|uniref:PstS family phosphate ABC transporter substrate-binding protein n=1 Tax=Undibacterium sp. Ji50W TaxID=3413041 RepID=UPI003BF2C446
MKIHSFLLFVIALAFDSAYSKEPDYLANLSPYHAHRPVSGTIRIGGNPYIPELMQAWQDGFQKHQPGVGFVTDMKGTETAMAGLYANIADIVFIGREPYRPEIEAFEDWYGYSPTGVKITSGSYATQHKTFALMVYVNKKNPLSKLSLSQLDALYGVERKRGAKSAIRTWGQLRLSGSWRHRPVHVYGYNFDTGMAGFFKLTVLKGSDRWNPELREFDNGRTADGNVINAGTYILNALANDPDGIAFANVLFENTSVKSISLAEKNGGPYFAPSKEMAWRRDYPLTRYSTAFINRPPGHEVDPKVEEFLRYILSRDGMEAVVNDAAFLPLNIEEIRNGLKTLD